jgi:hypothetical protein
MRKSFTAAVAIVGACALIGSLLTNALASKPAPLRGLARTHDKKFAVNGSLNVTGVLKVNKNVNIVRGKLYAHNGAQIWKRLTISGGGLISTPALQVTGPSAALFSGGATIAGNVSSGALSVNGALSTTGAASIGGKLTSIGGVDAGTGGVTTTGDIAAKNLNASGNITTTGNITTNQLTAQTLSITNFAPSTISTGAISAATLTTTSNASVGGTLTTTGDTTIGGTLRTSTITTPTSGGVLNFTGNVSFANAAVTGLGGGVGTNPATLTVGTSGATSPPLTITENNHSASIGVDTNGNMLFSTNLVSSGLIAPTPSGGTQGALSLSGVGINLTGTTTLTNGSDLTFSSGSGLATHILSAGDTDVAGTVQVGVPGTTVAGTEVTAVTRTFIKPYISQPIVTLTPINDPEPGSSTPPKVWITYSQGGTTGTQYISFTVHYVPSTTVPSSGFSPVFGYHVASL